MEADLVLLVVGSSMALSHIQSMYFCRVQPKSFHLTDIRNKHENFVVLSGLFVHEYFLVDHFLNSFIVN